MTDFSRSEKARVSTLWQEQFGSAGVLGDRPFQLAPRHRALNLFEGARSNTVAHFQAHGIAWHRYADHALSSQVACLNFLMPIAGSADIIGRLVTAITAEDDVAPEVIAEAPDGSPMHVDFEWIGRADYLGEWSGTGTRGANVTSTDAIIRYRHAGRVKTLLIEWKYTESYTSGLSGSNATRCARYEHLAFAPVGPIRDDLGLALDDFLHEPVYQVLRQQMLALGMERAQEDGTTRVTTAHLSPVANRALHRVTAPALAAFGDDIFDAFRTTMVEPQRLICRTIEDVFADLLSTPFRDERLEAWRLYVRRRYLPQFSSP